MAERKKKKLIVGFLAVLILGAGYLALDMHLTREENEAKQRSEEQARSRIVLALEEEKLSSISFDGDEGSLTFVREKGNWICPLDADAVLDREKLSPLLADLSCLEVTRILEGGDDPALFGLGREARRIRITDTDAVEYELNIGVRNDGNGELYFTMTQNPDTIYMTRLPLDRDFSGSLGDFAWYEDCPRLPAEKIRRIQVDKEEDSYLLITPGDDSCTVEGDGNEPEPADLALVGRIQNQLANLSWLSDLEYRCRDFSLYGLDKPLAEIRVVLEGGEEAVFLVGETDEEGNYAVRLSGSGQVHSIRKEYLKDLLDSSARSFWSLSYSFVSIGDLESLTVTAGNEQHVLRRVSDNGLQTDENLHWFVDKREVDKEPFTRFYYDCVSVTAQERLPSVPQRLGDPVLLLDYLLKDGSHKTIRYYPADQNFYTAVYDNDSKAASTNRLYVEAMLESFRELLAAADYSQRQM